LLPKMEQLVVPTLFDPIREKSTFHLAGPDNVCTVLIPTLCRQYANAHYQVQFEFSHGRATSRTFWNTGSSILYSALTTDSCRHTFRPKSLYREDFICGVARDSRFGDRLNQPMVNITRDLILTRGAIPSVSMSQCFERRKKQQVIALGRLGWSLRKIQKATGVHRTTAAEYLRAAGIQLRTPGARGKAPPAKPTNAVTPDPEAASPAAEGRADPFSAKPTNGVTPDFGAEWAVSSVAAATTPLPGRSSSASACEPHREAIELWLSRGRNAKAIWQDLVDIHGFGGGYQSVKRSSASCGGRRQRKRAR